MPDRIARVWNGTSWEVITSTAAASNAIAVYQSASPSGPVTGQLWIDSDDRTPYVYTGSSWETFPNVSAYATSASPTFTGTANFNGNVNISGVLDLTSLSVSNALDMSNNSIVGVNAFAFADPGPNEGITWSGGNGWYIYESPDNLVTNSAGNLQFVQGSTRRMTIKTDGIVEITGVASISLLRIPHGTAPASPVNGDIWTTTTGVFARINGSTTPLGGATGGGTDQVFYNNDQTVTTNYSIPSNENSISAGPITINNTVTVTVTSGSVWSII